ncbi:MAG: helix-turn-helix transcriptional regulator [Acidobacteriia bacterium]|nr:helix-turn-helix transcriptional regulator [Terriglobia bacterium]
MDVRLVIKQRLEELGLEQRGLAAAARVTESYISQLLTRKKAPPAAGRTALYERMNAFLRLPRGKLSSIAEAQRREELKKSLAGTPAALFPEVRELLIRKCNPVRQAQLRSSFEKQSFGEFERFVTRTLLQAAQRAARDRMKNGRRPHGRAALLDFLHTSVFNVSPEHCSSFLAPLIDSWDIDLNSFALEIALNRRPAPPQFLHFQFVEMESGLSRNEEPGFREFISDASMSSDASPEEIVFLKSLKFKQHRPSPLYYYRELQSLRDPLHFPEAAPAPSPNHRHKGGAGKQLQPVSGKRPGSPSLRARRVARR